jgi:chitinase domain-containing protein 1
MIRKLIKRERLQDRLNHLQSRNGGPSAPIEWIMDNVEYLTNENNKHKLLIGLNLYAMSYLQTRSPEPLVMKTIIEKLQQSQDSVDELTLDGPKDQSLVWESDSLEGWFMDVDEYGIKQGKVWVPNLRVSNNTSS